MGERRATFQKTEMDKEGVIHPCYSITLTKTQIVLTLIISFLTVIGFIFGSVGWLEGTISDVAIQTFEKSLDEYHSEMVPRMTERVAEQIDSKIVAHQISAEAPFDLRLDHLNQRVTALETQNVTLIEQVRHNRDLLEEILRAVR
jgi:hypothetical protein